MNFCWGAGVAQLVKQSHFSSGHDLTAHGFEPCVGLCADAQSLEPASDSGSPSLSAPHMLMHVCSLPLSKTNSKKNKLIKFRNSKTVLKNVEHETSPKFKRNESSGLTVEFSGKPI